MHGGRIWVESQIEVGTTFFFTLPIAAADGAAARSDSALRSGDASRREVVLVADDDPDARDLLVAIARSHGYDAVAVTNGVEALEAISSAAPPALVLLDVGMPIMDGWAFLEEKDRDPAMQSMPVIVVSGQGDVAERVARAHARYVPKPISMIRLLEMMQAVSSRATSTQG